MILLSAFILFEIFNLFDDLLFQKAKLIKFT